MRAAAMKEMNNRLWLRLCIGGFSVSVFLILLVLLSLLLQLRFSARAVLMAAIGGVALVLLTGVFCLQMRKDICMRKKLQNMVDGNEEEPEQPYSADQDLFLDMTDQEMLDQVFREMQEALASSALKTEAELHALQNQINPHFLYNTLEIIRSRAIRRGNMDVAEMVEALGMLFRYCINSPGELATLEQELDNIHDYLLIQRYRYGDRFTYQEVIEDESEEVMNSNLPVMTLQPIIENALVHGINPKIEGGKIILSVKVLQNRIQILVEDDGVGIPEEELKRVRRSLREGTAAVKERPDSHSIGIAMENVNKRIQFYFGMQYGVDIASTQNVGTLVKVTLPRLRVQQQGEGT